MAERRDRAVESDVESDVEDRQREIVDARPEGDERLYTGEPVDTGDGIDRPAQQNTGAQNMRGGGEWPDPDTPPAPSAPGSVEGGDVPGDVAGDETDEAGADAQDDA